METPGSVPVPVPGRIVAGLITVAEGVVRCVVEQIPMLIHVLGTLVVIVILADTVGHIVGVGVPAGLGHCWWRRRVGIVAGGVVI